MSNIYGPTYTSAHPGTNSQTQYTINKHNIQSHIILRHLVNKSALAVSESL